MLRRSPLEGKGGKRDFAEYGGTGAASAVAKEAKNKTAEEPSSEASQVSLKKLKLDPSVRHLLT